MPDKDSRHSSVFDDAVKELGFLLNWKDAVKAAEVLEAFRDRHREEVLQEVAEVQEVLREVLAQIRPQGHPGWKLNTCLVTNDQLNRWHQVAETPLIVRQNP